NMSRPAVSATEFSKNFGRYQDQALSGEPVRVTSHGRVIGGFISEADLQHFERLKRRERQVLVVGALPDDVLADIAAAEYGAEPK
ncbi:MAG: type II toxin-antitoxin system Phd/YefM family antitoxin, partial [Rhodospirillaceae bacterium]|nr:type II toxin-antitoxin system Phd/YefM family antitoxin [Rhodospirillaceae bacterium]